MNGGAPDGIVASESPSDVAARKASATSLLDSAYDEIRGGQVYSALERVMSYLHSEMTKHPVTWRTIADDLCPSHPLGALLRQEPMTRRSCEKPRGYAGDAVLLDYIYGTGERAQLADVYPLAKPIHSYLRASFCAQSVRLRRQIIAELIDREATRTQGIQVLSIAAGHLREFELSEVTRRGTFKAFVAFDQDAESLATIRRDYGSAIRCHPGTVRDLLKGNEELGSFDLIYAAGLLDYLGDRSAAALIRSCFSMLRPKGKLLVANFNAAGRDTAYADSFMQWQLLYRTQWDLETLCCGIRDCSPFNLKLFDDHLGHVSYAVIEKM